MLQCKSAVSANNMPMPPAKKCARIIAKTALSARCANNAAIVVGKCGRCGVGRATNTVGCKCAEVVSSKANALCAEVVSKAAAGKCAGA